MDTTGTAHDLRQPLNVIRLTVANLRARLADRLVDADRSYCEAKLQRIEEQVDRLAHLLGTTGDPATSVSGPVKKG